MTIHRGCSRVLLASGASVALTLATPALAQSAQELAALKAEISELKAEQAIAAERIARLEAALRAGTAVASAAPAGIVPMAAPAASGAPDRSAAPPEQAVVHFASMQPLQTPTAPVNPAGGSAPGSQPAAIPSKLTLSGDLRLRYESNSGDRDARNRERLALRGRLRALYAVNKWLTIGGQLTTGDPNDPNSTDITLGGFDNDLTVSLDQAYIRANAGSLTVTGGKIPQPFVRTELVWDGDVSPAGVSASYQLDLGGGSSLRANGLYFVVDEAPAATDSHMIGGQLQFEAPLGPLRFELAAGYYDYSLRSVATADFGDFRTNRVAAGRYLSDFNLFDVVGGIAFDGLGERWPMRLVADYVRNYGATTDEDSGFGVDLMIGRGKKLHDWRFGYGYAETGVDAVLAAFSHDNTDLATNYRQHTLFAEYAVMPNTVLNATYYRYRPKSPRFTPTFLPDDWLNRLRLNMLINF